MTIPEKFAFKKGWEQLPQKSAAEVKNRIIKALGSQSATGFYARLNGQVEPKASEYLKIEAIFHEYGITEIWGE